MRFSYPRFIVASGALALACATATEDPVDGNFEDGGTSSGATSGMAGMGGSLGTTGGNVSTSGTGNTPTTGGTKGGSTGAFGGTVGIGGGGTGSAGKDTGGSSSGGKGGSGGSSSGGKGGSGGTSSTAGTSSGGKGGSAGTSSTAGTSNNGGSTSTTCDGVADWTSKAYAIGDVVASTCSGVFAGDCTAGQNHKFECNPTSGQVALAWCQQREPGVGNGWPDAWIDKGKCD
jgi:hypothetical protein